MNKSSIATALLLALAAAGASAAPAEEEAVPGPYLGAALGTSYYKFNFDCSTGSSCDKTPYGYKIFGGLPMSKHFALEVQYIQYGEAEAVNGPATLTGQGRHFGVGVAASKHFGARWTGIARAGLASNKFKTSGSFAGVGSSNVSENKVSVYAGASFGFRVTPNLTIEGALDVTRFEFFGDHANASMLSLGVRNQF